jgi:hypothetical protein
MLLKRTSHERPVLSQANMAAARWNLNFSGQRWARQCGAP